MTIDSDVSVTIQTSWGDILVGLVDGMLGSIDLPHCDTRSLDSFDVKAIQARSSDSVDGRILRRLETFMQALFSGRPADTIAFIPPAGTDFSQHVWAALCQIPCGETRSYGDLARQLGRPGAARAVGRACGANPLPLVIPCHRVVAASGALGGFSCGLAWKKLLLEIEKERK